jgi:hypothetical protein
MKTAVSDGMVAEYVARVRRGEPTTDVFPGPMSGCEFTEEHRAVIRQARADRKALLKNGTGAAVCLIEVKEPVRENAVAGEVPRPKPHPKTLSKLGRLLYLQRGRCFFCGEPLKEGEANIEHLNPKSRGGSNDEDNEVVCHRSLNEAFGSMGLKAKFEFVLRAGGKFECPK